MSTEPFENASRPNSAGMNPSQPPSRLPSSLKTTISEADLVLYWNLLYQNLKRVMANRRSHLSSQPTVGQKSLNGAAGLFQDSIFSAIEDDPTWLHQLVNSSSANTSTSDQPNPTANQSQFSIQDPSQDPLNSYIIDTTFLPQSTPTSDLPNFNEQASLHVDPVVFHTPNLPSVSAFSRVGSQQARRATVSLASPHYSRSRYQADQTIWTGPSGCANHNLISTPATLNAAHSLLAAWASGTSLPSSFTIPEETDASLQVQSDWNPQSLPHAAFDNTAGYAHSTGDTRYRSTSLSFLGGFFPTDSLLHTASSEALLEDYGTTNLSGAEPESTEFLNYSTLPQDPRSHLIPPGSDLVSPSIPQPLESGLFSQSSLDKDGQVTGSRHRAKSNSHDSQSDSDNGIHTSTESSRAEIRGSRTSPTDQSDSHPSVGSFEAPAYAPALPPLPFPESFDHKNGSAGTCTQSWIPADASKAPLAQDPHSSNHFDRGLSYTYGPISNFDSEEASRSHHTNQFLWDEKFLTTLENFEPRRESDPFPAAPVPQRPWEQRHRYSIATMPFEGSTSNAFGNTMKSVSDLEHPNALDSITPSYSRQFASFTTQASEPTSAGPDTAATSVFDEGRLDGWSQSQTQPVHHTHNCSSHTKASSLGALGLNQFAMLPPVIPQTSTEFPQPNGGRSHDETGVVGARDPSNTDGTKRGWVSRNARQLGYVNGQVEASLAPQEPLFGFGSEPTYGFQNFAARYTPPVGRPQDIVVERLPELTLPPACVPNNGPPSIDRPPTRLRRLTMLTQPLWTSKRPEMPSRSSSYGHGSSRPVSVSWNEQPREHTKVGEVVGYEHGQKTGALPLPSRATGPSPQSTQPLSQSQGKKRERSLSMADPAPPLKYSSYDEPSRYGGLGQGPSPYPPGLNGAVRPNEEDFNGKTGEGMIPWQQELRCDEDLYTPIWCRGQNDKKEGFCDMCEGGAWLRLKNSAFWYHKQYYHGVSSTTGHYFYPPRETKRGLSSANRQQILGLCHECNDWVGYSAVPGSSRRAPKSQAVNQENGSEGECNHKEGTGNANEEPHGEEAQEEDLAEIGDDESSQKLAKEKADSKVPTLWYKHAHKCHRHQTCKGAKGRKKGKKNGQAKGKGTGAKKVVV
ncbi:uncharacterized protein MELLADRAFT_105649 [Melampsora larici-populina 98AG31]|uniref:Transcription regulator Rua1 C-terminal domain-containing protein n=1 Tax=Melampsora larici-populina (strain 98AG31 / pathotype 3-4-7) TaxID=747676 RepID=F4RIX1_MELLP|nr:uncharacterized protein MELLADRAFT_105649 [Melampsora larici-populina 98AG31]EGG07636.1 hypothetical protein MELLADRAFT_105649 [Melampsora larici-populina 98AG31]